MPAPRAMAPATCSSSAFSASPEAIGVGAFRRDWSFIGIGAVEGGDRIQIGPDSHLELLKRSDQAAYAALLPEHDVGLSLMCTPHPSLVPIEMALPG